MYEDVYIIHNKDYNKLHLGKKSEITGYQKGFNI